MSVSIDNNPSPWDVDYGAPYAKPYGYANHPTANQVVTPLPCMYYSTPNFYLPLDYQQHYQARQVAPSPVKYDHIQTFASPVDASNGSAALSLPAGTTFQNVADNGSRRHDLAPEGFHFATSFESTRQPQLYFESNEVANEKRSTGNAVQACSWEMPSIQQHQSYMSSHAESYPDGMTPAPNPSSLPYVIVSRERIRMATSPPAPISSASVSIAPPPFDHYHQPSSDMSPTQPGTISEETQTSPAPAYATINPASRLYHRVSCRRQPYLKHTESNLSIRNHSRRTWSMLVRIKCLMDSVKMQSRPSSVPPQAMPKLVSSRSRLLLALCHLRTCSTLRHISSRSTLRDHRKRDTFRSPAPANSILLRRPLLAALRMFGPRCTGSRLPTYENPPSKPGKTETLHRLFQSRVEWQMSRWRAYRLPP